MAITKVNGALLRRMVINGAINLKNNYQEIDQLNVFPVPDGDTGTNMSMTMMAGVREIDNADVKSLSALGKTLSRGLLMGARGNSGVILSQFFRGIYTAIKPVLTGSISLEEFAAALTCGYQTAYKAVMEPVEGTILTVVREAAVKVNEKIQDIKDMESLLKVYLDEAKHSLSKTPELLPVLKEAGVVDSGGAGFVKIVEGMLMAVQGTKLTLVDPVESSQQKDVEFQEKEIKYGYCTEFILELQDPSKFDETELRDILTRFGDSLVLVQDEGLCKVHVHTNQPGVVLNNAQQYGEFVTLKIENMRKQHSELIVKEEAQKNMPKQKYALVAVCFGDGIKESFKELGVNYIIDGGQTMNPSTEQFVKAIENINAENVIIIPNNSNVILAAEQSAKLIEGVNIRVLKAKTIAAGYASLMVFDLNNDIDKNYEDMTEAINHMKSGEVTYAVRDTEIKGVKITSGDFMGISKEGIVCSLPTRAEATKDLLSKLIDEESEIVTLFYGIDVSDDEVEELAEFISTLNEDIEVEIIEGKQEIYSYIIAVE